MTSRAKIMAILAKCGLDRKKAERCTEALIAEGVSVPPFSIGQTVYVIEYSALTHKHDINPYKITSIEVDSKGYLVYKAYKLFNCGGMITCTFVDEAADSTVFATEGEAVKEVAERVKRAVLEAKCPLMGLELLDKVEEGNDAN